MAACLLLCAALAAGSGPLRPPAVNPSADDVVPIDFNTAIRVARSSLESGSSPERAVADAELVLAGERPFASLSSLPIAGGYLCNGWLTDSETRLALHAAVTARGWELVPHGRTLALGAPLPAWLAELASRLAPAFDGRPPDACELYALEPDAWGDERRMAQPAGAFAPISALVSLLGRGRLRCSLPGGGASEVELPSASCLLLRGEAHARLVLQATAAERHLAIVFHRSITPPPGGDEERSSGGTTKGI